MPRLSANPGFLFNEVSFLDRFGEAARVVDVDAQSAYRLRRGAARARHRRDQLCVAAWAYRRQQARRGL